MDELGKHYAVNNPDAKWQIFCDLKFIDCVIEAEKGEVVAGEPGKQKLVV